MNEEQELVQSWNDFCDRLKEAGEIIQHSSSPQDAFNRAEGFRYLTRVLRAGLESQVESANPSYPRFFQLANETIKIGNDNPDNIYHNANLDGRLDYRIRGHRGTVHYMSFGTKAGGYQTTGTMEPTGQLEAADLEIDADGRFEILVSRTPQTKNWLPMTEHSNSLIVRQTFNDRETEVPASYEIECLNPQGSDQLVPAEFMQRLAASAEFVNGTAALFAGWMQNYSKHINQLPYDDQEKCQRAGGDASIHYLQSYWKLAPDEALRIHAPRIPRCTTWNFQLSNYWMESLDYRYHTVSFNQHTAAHNEDGSVTLLVAHRDPGNQYPNWIETCGHDQGGMLWRWIELQEAGQFPVNCDVIKLENR